MEAVRTCVRIHSVITCVPVWMVPYWVLMARHALVIIIIIIIITSLNWSLNGSKNYTVDSVSRNRCQRPLTNCHIAETAGK